MANGPSSEGSVSQLAIDGTELCFVKCIPESVYEIVDPSSELICGTLEHDASDTAPGLERHAHRILMHPSPQELALILPKAGFTKVGTTYTIGDAVAESSWQVNRVEQSYQYAVSYIGQLILRSQKGAKPWSLELLVIHQDEAEAAFTASPPAARSAPFAFHEGALFSSYAANRRFNQYAIYLDHKMVSRFENAAIVDTIQPTDHEFAVGVSSPFTTDEKDIYTSGTGATRHEGTAGSITHTRGGLSFIATFGNMVLMAQPPAIRSKADEIRLDQFYRLRKDGATPSIVITLDDTE